MLATCTHVPGARARSCCVLTATSSWAAALSMSGGVRTAFVAFAHLMYVMNESLCRPTCNGPNNMSLLEGLMAWRGPFSFDST